MRGGRPARTAIILAAVATLVVFAIPHSAWGSELKWDSMPAGQAVTSAARLGAAARAALAATLVLAGCGVSGGRQAQPAAAAVTDLAAAERLGGHTLARHVGRTDDDLRERLRREPDIAAASTYSDRQTAERVVAETLRRSSRRMEAWSARTGSRPNLALDYRGESGQPIGRSLRRGDARVRACTDAVVVLRWHASGLPYILTSYPECRQ